MNKKCKHCGLVNYLSAQDCIRCGKSLSESENIPSNGPFLKSWLAKRAAVCGAAVLVAMFGFYASLALSADKLNAGETAQVWAAIDVLREKGFTTEAFLLRRLVVFRGNDNWLNASVEKENAYAATNFPFEIVTVYPDFFEYTTDDTERAAILLHEAQHLLGKDEKEAYEFVWKNRSRLGWTADVYRESVIWQETRKLTKEYLPGMFVCDVNDYGDCTER